VVDARKGERSPAFDHARAAAALAKASSKEIAPTRLPVDSIEFRENNTQVRLVGASGAWTLDLSTYEAVTEKAPEPSSLPFDRQPRPSRRTGPETEITFHNQLEADVELFWIDTDGARQSYGWIKKGQERTQHTFGGHVWLVNRPGTGVVAVFEAADSKGRAVIDNREPERRRAARRRGQDADAPRDLRTTSPSPDGRWEAFVRDHNLWIRETSGANEAALSFDGSPGCSFHQDTSRDRLVGMEYDKPEAPDTLPEVFWSPDSKRLVALQTRSVPERRVHLVESSPKDQLQPRTLSYPYLKAGDELPVQGPRLFDIAGRKEIAIGHQLFENPWSIGDVRWASDSSRFTFVYNQRGHQLLRLIAVDAATGAARSVVEERSATFIDYSGKFLCEWLSDDALLWMSERDGWNHLYLYEVATGQVKAQVTRGPWNVRQLDRVDREKRLVWFRAVGLRPNEDPYHVHVARVALDGSGLTILTEGDGTHSIQWSPDHGSLIDTWSRVDAPPSHVLRSAEDGHLLCQLENADASEVIAARGRFPERFVAKGRDGATDIHGIIHRPKDFDASKKYPVIENIYAGPHDHHVPKAFRSVFGHQHALADRGFIVVQIDGMGTSWRSKAFHDVCWKNLRDAGFPDRIAWMKAAGARFPEMDLTRVGIYGGSAGGQNAMAALVWHGDFYKAGVADCGCHDNRMDKIWWNEQWMGWPVGPHYAENSNTVNAHRLQGHLLLVVGELDKNVDPATTMQAAAALIKAEKDVELLVVPGAGHGSAETPYGTRRRTDFFVRHLLGK
jgi:dipeptidyl aminopeptidase/acylaminoacyl peptidase